MTNRFTVTMSYSYDVTDKELAEYYHTRNLKTAAAMDREVYEEDPLVFTEDVRQHDYPFTVTVFATEVPE